MILRDKIRRQAVWHLRSARLSLRLDDAERAFTEITRFLKISSAFSVHSAAAFLMAADALIKLKQYEQAQNFARIGLLSWPHLSGFAARLLHIDLLQGNYQQAISGARRMILQTPNMKNNLLNTLGDACMSCAQYDNALQAYRCLYAMNEGAGEDHESLLMRLSKACHKAGFHDEGLRYLQLMKQPPLVLNANLLHGAGRLIEALDMYDAILGANGLIACREDKQTDNILSYYSARGATLDDVDENALLDISLSRVDILDRLGRVASLEKIARWEIANPSEDAQIRIALGFALVKRGCAALAVQLVRKDRHSHADRSAVFRIILSASEITGRNHLADICVKRLMPRRGTVLRAERDSVFGRLFRMQTLSYCQNRDGRQELSSGDSHDELKSLPDNPLTRLVRHACHALEHACRNDVCMEEYDIHLSRCRGVLDRNKTQIVSPR